MSYPVLIATVYVLFNSISIMAYLPQVIKLFKSRAARMHVAISTWSIWTVGASIEFLYARSLGNIPWQAMSCGHFVACLTVVLLALSVRRPFLKKPLPENALKDIDTEDLVEDLAEAGAGPNPILKIDDND